MKSIKNISFNKSVKRAIILLTFLGIGISLIAASNYQSKKTLNGPPIIHLNDENEFSFLQKKDIEQWLLKNRNIHLETTRLDQIDLHQIERFAEQNPWVKKADLYIDNQRRLHIQIEQRTPVARVFFQDLTSAYVDSAGFMMPVSKGYTFPTVIFSNLPNWKGEEKMNRAMQSIAHLGAFISNDTFWNSQINQIEVQYDGTFIATTLLGEQKILLGDASRIQEKLANLFVFYKNISKEIGWNTYDTFDLRFKGQIVASPTIGKNVAKNETIKDYLKEEGSHSVEFEGVVENKDLISEQTKQRDSLKDR